MELKFKL